ncbi:MAG: hypothetical protein GXP55_01390 [Deltaproteobacteria bacterium]|nr:hypothetical protein [Deltaproteobacteria bacterium]
MASERGNLRLTVLSEDKRTERFFRELLKSFGFRKLAFHTAPSGRGSGEAWVTARHVKEIQVLRSRNYQRSLRLIAVRDGDGFGIAARKQQLQDALERAELLPRQSTEGIATPVPSRNIETWLLTLLGAEDVDETADCKHAFEAAHATDERAALKRAAAAWPSIGGTSLPSLRDGVDELKRIDG